MFGYREAHFADKIKQKRMAVDGSSAADAPLLPSFLINYACKVFPLKDKQSLFDRRPFLKFGQQDSISRAVDVEPMWLVVLPLPVDILSVGQVDEGGPVELVLAPVRDVEGKIVVNEDAQTMAMVIACSVALVLAVTIVEYIRQHFLILKYINTHKSTPNVYIAILLSSNFMLESS